MPTITTFGLILSGIQALLASAPSIVGLADQIKTVINNLFGSGVITADEQNALHAVCDAHMAATLAGQRPAALVVDPD